MTQTQHPLETLSFDTLLISVRDSVVHVTLNRPRVRNAMNFKMIAELTTVFHQIKEDRSVRAVLLSGAGGVFCAGGDIKEMRENTVPASDSAHNLDAMLRAANQSDQIVIARIEGAALGGGFGLACVSDVAIASTEAVFGLPEVTLGIAPAFISPFVLQRIGLTRARELMLTGRRFKGAEAQAYGLVHQVCAPDDLDACVAQTLSYISKGAPGAIAATKQLIFAVQDQPLDDTVDYRADLLNTLRQGDEAQEGMLAFMEKRPARWTQTETATNGAIPHDA